jgi:hypothetical protein
VDPPAEIVAADADDGHFDAGFSELSFLHSLTDLSRPHGEEREARLEPWGRPILRDAAFGGSSG